MIVSELEKEFGPAVVAKASHLHGAGDAIRGLQAMTVPAPFTWRVSGEVQDKAQEPYGPVVEVTAEPGSGRFEVTNADCSCPMEAYCEHGAALLLRWVSRWPLTLDGRGYTGPVPLGPAPNSNAVAPTLPAKTEVAPDKTVRTGPVVKRVALSSPLQEWLGASLKDVDNARPREDKAAGGKYESIIVYVVSDDARMHALRGRRLRAAPSGTGVELTGERASNLWVRHGRERPSYASEADRAIFTLGATCERDSDFALYSIAHLSGATGHQLLELARGTGRLHAWPEASIAAAMVKGASLDQRQLPPALKEAGREAASLVWRSRVDAEFEKWVLAATVRGTEVTLLPVDPPYAIDVLAARLIAVDVAVSTETLVRLSTLPALPRADSVSWAYVRDAIGALLDAQQVPPLPVQGIPVLTQPRAILEFAWIEHHYQHGWGRHAHTETLSFPGVHLWFDYGGRRVPVNTYGFGQAVEQEIEEGITHATHLRNVRAETMWIKRVPAPLVPAIQVERTLGQAIYDGKARINSMYAIPRHDWITHGASVLAEAQSAGFDLEVDTAFPISMEDVPEAELELVPAQERGWFRMSLGVMAGGERVDIAPPLAKLIGAQADPEAWLEALPSVPSVLLTARSSNPDQALKGRVVVVRLSGERIYAILKPVFDWFRGGALEQISALQAAVNTDLPASVVRYLGRDDQRWIALREAVARGVVPKATEPAPGFAAVLRPYQNHGLMWLEHLYSLGMSGVLADDMGLGKTVQTLAFLQRRHHAAAGNPRSLIIAPTSVTVNWQAELHRFAPGLRLLMHLGQSRSLTPKRLAAVDVVVTSYPILQRDEVQLAALDWDIVVFDEAQTIKNPKAKTYQAAQSLKSRMRLALTGTPMENHLGELWALFNLLLPGLLGDLDSFNRIFRHPIEQRSVVQQMAKLRDRIRPFMLRRTREAVLGDLPEKTEYTRWIELDARQADLYESLRTAIHEDIRKVIDKKGLNQSTIHILDALLKLRQVCCDPRLVKLPESRSRFADAGSAKLDWLMTHIPELLEEGRQVLVFSQFTSMLALIADGLLAQGIAFETLTGETHDRETPVARFQSGDVRVFLLSLKAGGVGLNLTAADTVIHYDPWWNPAVEAQATARAHRIGQEKPVFVTKLVSRGTLEERMMGLLDRKRELAAALLQGEGHALSGLTMADVESLLAPITSLQETHAKT